MSFKNSLLMHMLAVSAFANLGNRSFNHEDDLDKVDIEKEYEKIQQKKSGLSKKQREIVISKYKRIRDCKTCYWKITNQGQKGFCYMFEAQMMDCGKYKNYQLENKEEIKC